MNMNLHRRRTLNRQKVLVSGEHILLDRQRTNFLLEIHAVLIQTDMLTAKGAQSQLQQLRGRNWTI